MEQPTSPTRQADRGTVTERGVMTVADIAAHVSGKQGIFLDTLASATEDLGLGWESIQRDARGKTVKRPIHPNSPGAFFTGDQLCSLAAFALADGIRIIASEDIEVEVISFVADFNRENWGINGVELGADEHCVVSVTSPEQPLKVYLDPTYAASDHREVGKIRIIPEDKLDDDYKIAKSNEEPYIVGANGRHEEIREELLRNLRLSKKQYLQIVSSLI